MKKKKFVKLTVHWKTFLLFWIIAAYAQFPNSESECSCHIGWILSPNVVNGIKMTKQKENNDEVYQEQPDSYQNSTYAHLLDNLKLGSYVSWLKSCIRFIPVNLDIRSFMG